MDHGLILLSGGLDLALAAILLGSDDCTLEGLTLDYPGRPRGEVAATKRLASKLPISSLVSISLVFPVGADLFPRRNDYTSQPPVEGWIPYRNLVFWSIAATVAFTRGATFVAGGHEELDARTYSDASPAFFRGLAELYRYSGSTPPDKGLDIRLPLLSKSNEELRDLGSRFRSILNETWSCWRDNDEPCGACFSCSERATFMSLL